VVQSCSVGFSQGSLRTVGLSHVERDEFGAQELLCSECTTHSNFWTSGSHVAGLLSKASKILSQHGKNCPTNCVDSDSLNCGDTYIQALVTTTWLSYTHPISPNGIRQRHEKCFSYEQHTTKKLSWLWVLERFPKHIWAVTKCLTAKKKYSMMTSTRWDRKVYLVGWLICGRDDAIL